MSLAEKIIYFKERNVGIEQLPERGKIFTSSVIALEKLIGVARQLPGKNHQLDDNKWNYHRGFGMGTLIVPFGKDGLAEVTLSVGSDIGNDDLSGSRLVHGAAVWTGLTRQQSKRSFALVVYPNIEAGGRENLYFFYKQPEGDSLRLTEFGSSQSGWYAISNQDEKKKTLDFKTVQAPLLLEYPKLIEMIKAKKDSNMPFVMDIL